MNDLFISDLFAGHGRFSKDKITIIRYAVLECEHATYADAISFTRDFFRLFSFSSTMEDGIQDEKTLHSSLRR